MTTGLAGRVVAGVMVGLFVLAGTSAGADDTRRVVLHLNRLVVLPDDVLSEAERQVDDLYGQIGVRLEWTGGHASLAPQDGAEHLEVIIVAEDRSLSWLLVNALGQANHGTRRAHIFYRRVVRHAKDTKSDLPRALAFALAHEIGHLLLPPPGHSDDGLMRATWHGPIDTLPPFEPSQADRIRELLAVRRPLAQE